MEGLLAIQAGDNPRIVKDTLQGFLAPADRTVEPVAANVASEADAACADVGKGRRSPVAATSVG